MNDSHAEMLGRSQALCTASRVLIQSTRQTAAESASVCAASRRTVLLSRADQASPSRKSATRF